MNPEQPNQPGGQPRQLNLQQLANQMLGGLQRHFDMLAFNIAAHECVTEEAYHSRVQATKVMPAAPAHQNFEQMQAYAQDLMMRQVINDVLNLAVAALNNSHLFLAAIKAQKEFGQNQEGQQQANQSQQAFAQAQLDEKFNQMEQGYGVLCELEDTIISLGFAMQALVQNGAMVQQAHLDEQGELAFDLKAFEVTADPEPGQPGQGRLIDQRKVLREGEAVTFNRQELQLLLITAASFFDQLFKAVARYAEENNPNAGQQPEAQ
ncbi:MAG: hypothetical protein AAFX93_02050 [Verrucomicrobiota bacterium]